jgi:heme/copper-type cytochrome/quinol oxidase subunit 2
MSHQWSETMKVRLFTKKIPAIIMLVVFTFFVGACAQAGELDSMAIVPGEAQSFESFAEEEAPLEAPGAPSVSGNIAADVARTSLVQDQVQEHLIIRNGHMDIVVQDTEGSLKQIAALAEAKEGWVVDSEVYKINDAKSGTITIRVPAEQFNRAMEEIRSLAFEVSSESTSSQDVTEEFVDLEARVANLEATADRVRGFLEESKSVEEALAVNAELSRLEGEIESLKARMKFLSQSAAFSRIIVQVTPDKLSQPIEVGGWRPEGVALSALEALISAFQAIAKVLIWLIIFCLPFILILGIPAFFIIRYFVRRHRKRSAAGQDVEAVDEDNANDDSEAESSDAVSGSEAEESE